MTPPADELLQPPLAAAEAVTPPIQQSNHNSTLPEDVVDAALSFNILNDGTLEMPLAPDQLTLGPQSAPQLLEEDVFLQAPGGDVTSGNPQTTSSITTTLTPDSHAIHYLGAFSKESIETSDNGHNDPLHEDDTNVIDNIDLREFAKEFLDINSDGHLSLELESAAQSATPAADQSAKELQPQKRFADPYPSVHSVSPLASPVLRTGVLSNFPTAIKGLLTNLFSLLSMSNLAPYIADVSAVFQNLANVATGPRKHRKRQRSDVDANEEDQGVCCCA